MHKRKLCATGFEVAPLAFGGNIFGCMVDPLGRLYPTTAARP